MHNFTFFYQMHKISFTICFKSIFSTAGFVNRLSDSLASIKKKHAMHTGWNGEHCHIAQANKKHKIVFGNAML